jgi:hypothetical protein
LELEKFGTKSKNETTKVQARYFEQILVTLFFTCKIFKNTNFKTFNLLSNISTQMEILDFLTNTFSLPLVSFSKTIVQQIYIWTWKNTPKVSAKIMLVFQGNCG